MNPPSKIQVTLLMYGSFDPVTNMHLRTMESAKSWLNSTSSWRVVKGLLSPSMTGVESDVQRMEMCQKAVRSSDWLDVDKYQVVNQVHATALDVLRFHLNQNEPVFVLGESDGPTEYMLVCGIDGLAQIGEVASSGEDLLQARVICVVGQPGDNVYDFICDHPILQKYKYNFLIVPEMVRNSVDPLQVRKCLKRGESVRYLVPQQVIDHIYKNGLYGVDRRHAFDF